MSNGQVKHAQRRKPISMNITAANGGRIMVTGLYQLPVQINNKDNRTRRLHGKRTQFKIYPRNGLHEKCKYKYKRANRKSNNGRGSNRYRIL